MAKDEEDEDGDGQIKVLLGLQLKKKTKENCSNQTKTNRPNAPESAKTFAVCIFP